MMSRPSARLALLFHTPGLTGPIRYLARPRFPIRSPRVVPGDRVTGGRRRIARLWSRQTGQEPRSGSTDCLDYADTEVRGQHVSQVGWDVVIVLLIVLVNGV